MDRKVKIFALVWFGILGGYVVVSQLGVRWSGTQALLLFALVVIMGALGAGKRPG